MNMLSAVPTAERRPIRAPGFLLEPKQGRGEGQPRRVHRTAHEDHERDVPQLTQYRSMAWEEGCVVWSASLDAGTKLPSNKVELATKRLGQRRSGKVTATFSHGRDKRTRAVEADEGKRIAREGATPLDGL